MPDFATNLMLYCAKREVPNDLDLVHTVRTRIANMAYRRVILFSLVDFVEKFGANPGKVLEAISEVDGVQGEVEELYISQEFNQALEASKEAASLMDEVEAIAERVKNEALFWVYVSEWLVVAGTSLICGLIIWTLMIRRRLYREVTITQFR